MGTKFREKHSLSISVTEFKLFRISHQSFQRHSEGQLPNIYAVF